MKSRLLSSLLAALLALSLLPVTALTDGEDPGMGTAAYCEENGHEYLDGACVRCGEPEPAASAEPEPAAAAEPEPPEEGDPCENGEPAYAVAVTVGPGEGGTVDGAGEYREGETVTLTVVPEAGYVLDALTAAGTDEEGAALPVEVGQSFEDTYEFRMPACPVTVTAVFRENVQMMSVRSVDLTSEAVTTQSVASVYALASSLRDANVSFARRTGRFTWDTEGKSRSWTYYNGIMMDAYLMVDSDAYFSDVNGFYDANISSQGRVDSTGSSDNYYRENELDSMPPVRAMFDLLRSGNISASQRTKYTAMIRYVYDLMTRFETVANTGGNFKHKMNNSSWSTYQIALDGLYMAQPFFMELAGALEDGVVTFSGAPTADSLYAAVVSRMVWIGNNLYDPGTGLYNHGWGPSVGVNGQYWLRAVGWYAAALADVIDMLPDRYAAERAQLIAIEERLFDGMLAYQDGATGMWYNVINYGPGLQGTVSQNALESSGSALMAYAMLRTYADGYVDSYYGEAGLRAFNGTVTNELYSGGLHNVYISSGVSTTAQGYLNKAYVTNEAKGVGPLMMAAVYAERAVQRLYHSVVYYSVAAAADPIEGGSVTGAGEYEAGAAVTLIAEPAAGYDFIGWTENGETVAADAAYTFSVGGDRTLTAVFAAQPVITFVNEDGTVLQSGPVSRGATPKYTGEEPTKADANYTYVFDGWTPELVPVTGDATYTAVFRRYVTVTFMDGTSADTQLMEPGVKTPLKANPFSAPAGKSFHSWNTRSDGSGDTYYDRQPITPESKLTLYAQWVDYEAPTAGYTINWIDTVSNAILRTDEIDTIDALAQPVVRSYVGRTFTGWRIAMYGETVVTVENINPSAEALYSGSVTPDANEIMNQRLIAVLKALMQTGYASVKEIDIYAEYTTPDKLCTITATYELAQSGGTTVTIGTISIPSDVTVGKSYRLAVEDAYSYNGEEYAFLYWDVNGEHIESMSVIIRASSSAITVKAVYSADEASMIEEGAQFYVSDTFAETINGVNKVAATLVYDLPETPEGYRMVKLGFYYATGATGYTKLLGDTTADLTASKTGKTPGDLNGSYTLHVAVKTATSKQVHVRAYAIYTDENGAQQEWLDEGIYTLVWNELYEAGRYVQ